MPSQEVVDAVEARLAANWTLTPVRGVNLEGEAPEDGGAFLVVQYPVADETQISVGAPGANVWREEGAFRLVLNAERGQGLADALAKAGQLRSLFRGKIFGGVECFGPSPPAVDDRNDMGNYFQLSIAVPYRFDRIG